MKHSSQAKKDSLVELQNLVSGGACKRACLLIDLDGRIRILLDLADSCDKTSAETRAMPALTRSAEAFWSGQIWFDRSSEHPSGRLSPSERALFDAVWAEAQPAIHGSAEVSIINRRYSKETWFSDINPVWPHIVYKTPPIVSFYSFKGGVGRTTALASYAIQNARLGRRVLVLDLDLEAPGLSTVFPPNGSAPDVGILDYLIEQPVVGSKFDPAETVYLFDDKTVTGTGEIHVVSAGQLDEHYLDKLARLDYIRLAGKEESKAPLSQLLKHLKSSLKPDLILIDSRAGLDDIGGLALSPLAHYHIIVGSGSPQSWQGLSLAIDHLGRQRLLSGKKQLDCLIVQAHVNPSNTTASKEAFLHRSYEAFSELYYDDVSNTDAEWPIPDEMAEEEPHYPIAIVYDIRILGYSSVNEVAEFLCDSDYRKLAEKLNSLLGLS